MIEEEKVQISITNDADIVAARQSGREMAGRLGFSLTDATLIATAISEVARNIMTYARRGEIRCETIRSRRGEGLLVVAVDEGPGIADVEQALQDGYSTGLGMGLGLPGAKRLMDEFEIESEPGRGTVVTMRKWLAARGN
jgi:serine/threonine-protein kinase RsbT